MIRDDPNIQFRPTKPGTVYQSHIDKPIEPIPGGRDTLSKAFLHNVNRFSNDIAMRKKHFGIWQEYTWNEVYEHVENFAMGLVALGLQAHETVVIIGENDPEFYWTQIATHACRSRTCGVFSDATPPELEFVVKQTGATFIVAHDQEQVDKALEIQAEVPQVRRVVYWDDRGMWSYYDNWLANFHEIEQVGAEYKLANEGLFEELVAQTQPEDVIILSMTSGTTSLPKFAQITNHQLVIGNLMNIDYINVSNHDNWLSFSPMAWLTENAFGFVQHMVHGMKVNFPEGPETVPTDMREIAPVGLLFPSRVWEGLASSVMFRINDSSRWNRWMYGIFMPIANRIADLEDDKQTIPIHLRFMRSLGEFAIFEPLRDKLGLTRAKNVLTAGAALSPDVVRFFRSIGVELRQLYASTESLGTLHIPGDVKLGSVGVLVPGVELKIAEDQEILIRTEARFAGYFNAPEKTAEAIDVDGWYHTGDAGYVDEDGHLFYLDRVKDMLELRGGDRFSPQYIEGRLKFSPYIQDVMSIGGTDKDYVTTIVIIDFQNVARWAEKSGLSFTTFVDLSQKNEVYDLIQMDVERVNQSLPETGRVHKFVILHKEFDADEAELTRTRKLRRGTLQEKYANIINAMYAGQDGVNVRAEVKYRDGRVSVVETKLQVRDVM